MPKILMPWHKDKTPKPVSAPVKAQKRVLIGVPMYRQMHSQTVRLLINMVQYAHAKRPDISLVYSFHEGMDVASCLHCYNEGNGDLKARDLFVKRAVEGNFTHLLMVDSDMDFGRDTGGDIIAKLLDRDRDIIAPLFIRRSTPYDILAKRYSKEDNGYISISPDEAASGDLLEVDAVGAGMVMVKTDVLKQMERPWYVFQMVNGVMQAEDINFCRKAKKLNFRVWCDTSLHIDHLGDHRYRPEEGIAIAHEREERQKEQKVA